MYLFESLKLVPIIIDFKSKYFLQKRRLCMGSQSHSPKNSPRPLHVQSIPIINKNNRESKRRRQQRGSIIQKSHDHVNNNNRIKKEVFGSLESLFDLKKPLTLPELHSPLLNCCQGREKRTESPSSEFQSSRSPKRLDPSLFLPLFSNFTKLEPHIFIQVKKILNI